MTYRAIDNYTGKIAIMKVYSKKQLVEDGNTSRVLVDKTIHTRTHIERSPFVAKVIFTRQNPESLAIIADYGPYDNMARLLDGGPLDEVSVKVYLAQILLALQHLQKLKIVYSTVTLSSFSINKDKDIAFYDFGLPLGKPQDNLKSLGYMGCDLLLGAQQETSHTVAMLSRILQDPRTSSKAQALLSSLVGPASKKLQDHNNILENLKSHVFFFGLNWTNLISKAALPSIVPQGDSSASGGQDDKESSPKRREPRCHANPTPISVGTQAIFKIFTHDTQFSMYEHLKRSTTVHEEQEETDCTVHPIGEQIEEHSIENWKTREVVNDFRFELDNDDSVFADFED